MSVSKQLFYWVVILFFGCASNAQITSQASNNQGTLQVNIEESTVLPGYDFPVKYLIYIDGQLAGNTPEALRTAPHRYQTALSAGKHTLRIEYWLNRDGEWRISGASGFQRMYHQREIEIDIRDNQTLLFVINKTDNGLKMEESISYQGGGKKKKKSE